MKAQTFPMEIERNGVVARIYKSHQVHNGERYPGFVISYRLLGRRKQVWRTDLEEAKAAASDACLKISNGEQLSLSLTNGDRMIYLRAGEAIAGLNIPTREPAMPADAGQADYLEQDPQHQTWRSAALRSQAGHGVIAGNGRRGLTLRSKQKEVTHE